MGCKRKGRGGGAKFSQREFARDGQSQTAAIHSHKSAAHRGRTTDLRQRGFICSPAVWFLLRQETAGLKPVFSCRHGWPCGTPAPDGYYNSYICGVLAYGPEHLGSFRAADFIINELVPQAIKDKKKIVWTDTDLLLGLCGYSFEDI